MTEVGALVDVPHGRRGVVLEYREDVDAVRVALEEPALVRWFSADEISLAA